MSESTTLFVYGTLKRGFCRERFLASAKYLGNAETIPAYRLLDCGAYPALVDGGTTSIVGELYEVDESTMRTLDDVEGVDEGLYARREVRLADGRAVIAYLYTERTEGLQELGREWLRGGPRSE